MYLATKIVKSLYTNKLSSEMTHIEPLVGNITKTIQGNWALL